MPLDSVGGSKIGALWSEPALSGRLRSVAGRRGTLPDPPEQGPRLGRRAVVVAPSSAPSPATGRYLPLLAGCVTTGSRCLRRQSGLSGERSRCPAGEAARPAQRRTHAGGMRSDQDRRSVRLIPSPEPSATRWDQTPESEQPSGRGDRMEAKLKHLSSRMRLSFATLGTG